MTARTLLFAAALATIASVAPAAGQARNELPPPLSDPTVETAPIRCWWRTSVGAVTLGEPFDVRLTCAVLETDNLVVVPDESRLSVAGVPLKPFEVIGGSHPADTRAGDRRFFQYLYTLRLIDPNSIGQDITVPPLPITYKVETRLAADTSLTGRDFMYVMPDLSIRVVAQVPNDVNDIRDGSDLGLERLEGLEFRARLFDLGALAFFAGGVLLGALALFAAVTGGRPERVRERARIGDRRVLAAAGGELARVAREAESGWTPELVSAGHAALRVVAGLALGRGVSERPLPAGAAPEPGLIAVRSPLPRRPGAAVTSPATPADLKAAMSATSSTSSQSSQYSQGTLPPDADAASLSGLRDALEAFTAAQFSSASRTPDTAALSRAIDTGRSEASRLARARMWRRFTRGANAGTATA